MIQQLPSTFDPSQLRNQYPGVGPGAPAGVVQAPVTGGVTGAPGVDPGQPVDTALLSQKAQEIMGNPMPSGVTTVPGVPPSEGVEGIAAKKGLPQDIAPASQLAASAAADAALGPVSYGNAAQTQNGEGNPQGGQGNGEGSAQANGAGQAAGGAGQAGGGAAGEAGDGKGKSEQKPSEEKERHKYWTPNKSTGDIMGPNDTLGHIKITEKTKKKDDKSEKAGQDKQAAEAHAATGAGNGAAPAGGGVAGGAASGAAAVSGVSSAAATATGSSGPKANDTSTAKNAPAPDAAAAGANLPPKVEQMAKNQSGKGANDDGQKDQDGEEKVVSEADIAQHDGHEVALDFVLGQQELTGDGSILAEGKKLDDRPDSPDDIVYKNNKGEDLHKYVQIVEQSGGSVPDQVGGAPLSDHERDLVGKLGRMTSDERNRAARMASGDRSARSGGSGDQMGG